MTFDHDSVGLLAEALAVLEEGFGHLPSCAPPLDREALRGVLAEAARRLRERLAFLHHHDATWPDVGDEALAARLEEWLAPFAGGKRRLAELAEVDLRAALLTLVPWEQQRRLDELAPERIRVPGGAAIAVDYGDPAAPVLAVRLQQVFGMATSPTLLDGRVTVLMHLLSPAGRPVQVTNDLRSFWARGC